MTKRTGLVEYGVMAVRSAISQQRLGLLAALLTACLPLAAPGQENPPPVPLAKDPLYMAAVAALGDSVPVIAIEKLNRLIDSGARSGAELGQAKILLLEALVRHRVADDALKLSQDATLPAGSETDFWRAQAEMLAGNYADAEKRFGALAANPDARHRSEATFSRCNLLVLLGEHEQAITCLSPLFDHKDAEVAATARVRAAEIRFLAKDFTDARRQLSMIEKPNASLRARAAFLRGRMFLGEQNWTEAEKILAPLVSNPDGQDSRQHHACYLALADSYAGQTEKAKAESVLKAFIEKYPASPLLDLAFRRLDALGTFSENPVEPDLVAWAQSPQEDLVAVARYYLGVAHARAGSPSAAIAQFEAFVQQHPGHEFVTEGLLQLAELYLDASDWQNTHMTLARIREKTNLPEVLAHVTFLEARTRFASGEFDKAAKEFAALESAGNTSDTAAAASFNAALTALRIGDEDLYTTNAAIIDEGSRDQLRSDLALQRALYLASQGDTRAAPSLLEFVKRYPDHPQFGRIHIALAEISFLGFPPKPVSARQHLDFARALPLSEEQARQVDYIGVWVAESAGEIEEAIELGKKFIEKWQASPRAPEMRMKLGELYLQLNDYPNAVTQFELLVEASPQSPLAETALFFAGKAARLTMNPNSIDKAIEIWGRVIGMDGKLALAARKQQALAKMDLGHESEAVTVFDSILGNKPPPTGDLLYSVLCSKGQALFVMSSERENALDEAIATFELVSGSAKATPFWRNQARVRQAKCLERRGDTAKALEIYYDVVRGGSEESKEDEPPEYLWFYRAGFEAIRLLETQEDYLGAIKVADKLAESGGSRDQEAAELANRLRLEHFVWETPSGK